MRSLSMKKLLYLVCLSTVMYTNDTINIIEEIRRNIDYKICRVDANITKISEIKEIRRKEQIVEVLEVLFPMYLELNNPLSMKKYNFYKLAEKTDSTINEHYPLSKVSQFLHLTALYINEFPKNDLSNSLLAKTLMSMNKTIQEVESVSDYIGIMLLYKAFLEKMICQSSEQEYIIGNNRLVITSWRDVLKKEKEQYIKSMTDVVRKKLNTFESVQSDNNLSKMKNILSKEIDEFHKKIILEEKNSKKAREKNIEIFIDKKKKT